MDLVELSLVESEQDVAELRSMIEDHRRLTGSPVAGRILEHWGEELPRFLKVIPVGYKLLLEQSSE